MSSYRHTTEGYNDVFAAPRETSQAERDYMNAVIDALTPLYRTLNEIGSRFDALANHAAPDEEALAAIEEEYTAHWEKIEQAQSTAYRRARSIVSGSFAGAHARHLYDVARSKALDAAKEPATLKAYRDALIHYRNVQTLARPDSPDRIIAQTAALEAYQAARRDGIDADTLDRLWSESKKR